MKALVVGYGSIGARHVRLLQSLGCITSIVSSRSISETNVFSELDRAILMQQPDYVVVANATDRHLDSVLELAALGYCGSVLIEKPLFSSVMSMPQLPFLSVAVAYNLRFHPLIKKLRDFLASEKVLSVQCYVGQYLPDWRPGVDYRTVYSSHAEQGGGVLRDLSHELDYLQYLLGGWTRVSAIGGHFSHLEGDSDDIYGLMMAFEACPLVQIQLNYMDRLGRRRILINTDSHTIEVDLVAGTFTVDAEHQSLQIERDSTYLAMHRAMLGLCPDDRGTLCSLSEGLDTLRLISSIETSAASGTWQENEELCL